MESVPVRPGSRPRPILGSPIGADCAHCAHAAFTRLELLAVLAAVALLAMVALPGLAGNRVLSERLGCLNNLRQIGHAYHLWGHDHAGALPSRTPHCAGGLQVFPTVCSGLSAPSWAELLNNPWFHYAWISNELATPSLLACPGDATARPARDFSAAPDGGFLNPTFRNNAVSYVVALDVMPGQPLLFVSGDYNVSVGQYHHQCSSGVTDAAALLVNPSADGYRWLPGPHGDSGNLLLADGQVLQTSSEALRRYLDVYIMQQHDNGVYHLLIPRP